MPKAAPPPHYYAQNVLEVFHTVRRQYGDLLSEEETHILTVISTLSTDAIRLFARILSRKGPVFTVEQFQYPEILNIPSAVNELSGLGLIERTPTLASENLLQVLNKSQLRQIFSVSRTDLTKDQLIDHILDSYSRKSIHRQLHKVMTLFELNIADFIEAIQLLYFGNCYQDWSSFVVRDLGVLRLEQYQVDRKHRQFDSRCAINCYLNWSKLRQQLHADRLCMSTIEILELGEELKTSQVNRVVERLRSKLLNQLGRELERRKEITGALNLYANSKLPPARERSMRAYYRLGQLEACENLRQQIFAQEWNQEELQFAQRFKRKHEELIPYKFETLNVQSLSTDHIENLVIEHFTKTGATAWHLENYLPMALFGLAYWSWIYATIDGAFTNSLQIAPHDLYWSEFFEVRSSLGPEPIEQSYPLIQKIQQIAQEKRGLSNPFINWNVISESLLDTVLATLSEDDIRTLLAIIRQDLRQFRSGFPDLFVLNPNRSASFVEVKGPQDRVQVNQHIWLTELSRTTMNSYVLNVRVA